MSASILEQLVWRVNPYLEQVKLFGYLADEPQITLFIIHRSEENHERFDLLGAFVPDADEGSSSYDTIDQAKDAAGVYLSSWMTRRAEDFMRFHEERAAAPMPEPIPPPRCRVCGCTEDDCTLCIARTGQPCSWAEPDLCSACSPTPKLPVIRKLQPHECGSKPDWDFTCTGTLEEVIATCERAYAAMPEWCYFSIKAADPARGPIFYWLVWQEKEAGKEPA